MSTIQIITNPGTQFATTFSLTALSDDRYSLLAPEGVEADACDWPTDAQCSAAAGIAMEMFDAGDHPTRAEAILRTSR